MKIKNFVHKALIFDGNSTLFCQENLVLGSQILQVWTEEWGMFFLQDNCCGPTAVEGEILVSSEL